MLWWDLILRVKSIFNRSGAKVHADLKVPLYARRLFVLAHYYTGIEFQENLVLPEQLPETFLIISNHQSFIDIPFIFYHFARFRPRFIAKDQLSRGVPMASFLFRVQRHALIRRGGGTRNNLHEMTRIALMSRRGYCPVVFPEGTRSRDGNLGAFHAGAVRHILETVRIPVLCIALDGGYRVSGLTKLLHNMKDDYYRIKALKLYPAPRNKEEIREILKESRTLIDGQLEQWRRRGNESDRQT